jgi:hypothetical protein
MPDLLQRIETRLLEVKPLQEEGLYEVASEKTSGKTYTVDLLQGSCTCPSYQWRGIKCKHIRAAEAKTEESTEDLRERLLSLDMDQPQSMNRRRIVLIG